MQQDSTLVSLIIGRYGAAIWGLIALALSRWGIEFTDAETSQIMTGVSAAVSVGLIIVSRLRGGMKAKALQAKEEEKKEPPSLINNCGRSRLTVIVALWWIVTAAFCAVFAFNGCITMNRQTKEPIASYDALMVESLAMVIGYDAQGSLNWTDEMETYYQAIQSGAVTLDGAQAAEAYLRTMTHPVIANRLVELARIMGFGIDAGAIVDVSKVDISLLQAAARGFKQGLMLDRKQASVGDMWEVNYPVGPYHGGRLVTYLPYGIEVQ